MDKDKLVYRDGDFLKVLRGKLKDEDGFFLNFECDASIYKQKRCSLAKEG